MLLLLIACATRDCVGEDCSCRTDDDCAIGCGPEGCDCTNGWPVQVVEADPTCGADECATALCADWTEYTPRCVFGRCSAVAEMSR